MCNDPSNNNVSADGGTSETERKDSREKPSRDQYIELLKLYNDEWKFRVEQFWKLAIMLSVLVFFTSTLPVTIQIIAEKMNRIPDIIPSAVYPCIGFFFSLIQLYFLRSLGSRISAIDAKRKKIINVCFDKRFTKSDVPHHVRPRLVVLVPWAIAVVEMDIAYLMFSYVSEPKNNISRYSWIIIPLVTILGLIIGRFPKGVFQKIRTTREWIKKQIQRILPRQSSAANTRSPDIMNGNGVRKKQQMWDFVSTANRRKRNLKI